MMARDPKLNPAPGDVLQRGRIRREVIYQLPGDGVPLVVCLEAHADGFERNVVPWLSQWQRWAAKAEVQQREPRGSE